VRFEVQGDSYGRLIFRVADGGSEAAIEASNGAEAAAELMAAVEGAARDGYGECFWQEAASECRWIFRREGEKVRMVVLRSTGTLTGWEHLFGAECDLAEFVEQVREGLRQQGPDSARAWQSGAVSGSAN